MRFEMNYADEFYVRAFLCHQVLLAGTIEEAPTTCPPIKVRMSGCPVALVDHKGGSDALFFDFIPDSLGNLGFVGLEVNAVMPSQAPFMQEVPSTNSGTALRPTTLSR